MRLASALETTPNEFLIATNSSDNAEWEDIADMLRYFDKKKLSLTKNFLNRNYNHLIYFSHYKPEFLTILSIRVFIFL